MPRLLGICFIFSALIFGFASCKPEQPLEELCQDCGKNPCECEPVEPVDSTEYTIKFSAKAEYKVPAEASSKSVVFTCDGPWKVVVPEDAQSWISAEPAEGEGSTKRQSFTLKFAANTSVERYATVEVHAGISVAKIKITQQQVPLILSAADV